MWALTSIVLVGTADFIKFLTPQGYKSRYHCKCFKLFKLPRCSTLSPRLCTSHGQTTPSHTSLTAFTLLFSLILFLLHITPAISTGSSNSAALSRLRGGFSAIGLWSSQVFFFFYCWFYWFIFIIPFFINSSIRLFLCDLTSFQLFFFFFISGSLWSVCVSESHEWLLWYIQKKKKSLL